MPAPDTLDLLINRAQVGARFDQTGRTMTGMSKISAMLVIAMAASGAHAIADTTPRIAAGAVPPDFALTIAMSGCEGHCPEYTVMLDARGTVRWHGKAFVRTKGDARGSVTEAQVLAIYQKALTAQLLEAPAASLLCVDTPQADIVLTMAGQTHRIQSDSCARRQTGQGRKTEALIQFAETTMGIERWRGSPASGRNRRKPIT